MITTCNKYIVKWRGLFFPLLRLLARHDCQRWNIQQNLRQGSYLANLLSTKAEYQHHCLTVILQSVTSTKARPAEVIRTERSLRSCF